MKGSRVGLVLFMTGHVEPRNLGIHKEPVCPSLLYYACGSFALYRRHASFSLIPMDPLSISPGHANPHFDRRVLHILLCLFI